MLRPIEHTAPPPGSVPGPITDDEAKAMFRACVSLFRPWQVTDAEAATGRIGRDQKARMSNLMGIHKALRLIFRETDRACSWPRLPNAAFDGLSAMQVMLQGELTDLTRVRRCLDAERGGW